MTQTSLQSIVHPTDFSEAGLDAFAHALRFAVASRSLLHLLHFEREVDEVEWSRFPQVRDMLAQWRLIAPGSAPSAIERATGVRVVKAAIEARDPARGVGAYVERHLCDLLVLMTHERRGAISLLDDSVAEEAARLAHAPALFLREGQSGFVDRHTGAVALRTVLTPIDPGVKSAAALRTIAFIAHVLAPYAQTRLLHVGEEAPKFQGRSPPQGVLPPIAVRRGPVVETILSYAQEIGADLIAMPTKGRHGLLDALRGDTTEQVLRRAPCPVLAIPVD